LDRQYDKSESNKVVLIARAAGPEMAARHEQILREAGIDHREVLPAD